MGYAVDYKPTRKRNNDRQSPAGKQKLRTLRAMVKYSLPHIEERCACSETITRQELMALIGLNAKAPGADNDMQLILSEGKGAGIHPVGRMLGMKTYRCADVVGSFKLWCH
ncbi:hypothetical protein [Bifidobacterium felsineum]|uniref:hypothetical protein n=1 Tax=Bifidobacterium felsineum TaxID=2045440 RepID=UPI001BDBC9FA|nr:hypothetical protein [Bifidobacterium felsineum]MBT1164014.1 hypothetical protein [Bifidobacterium felsineum]